MKIPEPSPTPKCISDLILAQRVGDSLTCEQEFDIVTADFYHEYNPYRAVIFVCRFHGTRSDTPYSFRKCYARGCPRNHCTHVSQAVMVANRYLQRDYSRLEEAGILVDRRLFTLEEMIVKFDDPIAPPQSPFVTLEDCILQQAGTVSDVNVQLDSLPAVEHFAGRSEARTFLTADFTVSDPSQGNTFHRCLSCYRTGREEDRLPQTRIANGRLQSVYRLFSENGVRYTELFFR